MIPEKLLEIGEEARKLAKRQNEIIALFKEYLKTEEHAVMENLGQNVETWDAHDKYLDYVNTVANNLNGSVEGDYFWVESSC